MAINLKIRIQNLTSDHQWYYQYVDSGQGTDGSNYLYLGSASAGTWLTSSEFSSDLLNDYSAGSLYHSTTYVDTANLGSWPYFDGYEQGIYGPGGSGSPRPLSGSVQTAYFMNLSHPAGSGSTDNWQGSWTQYDSSNNLLDATGPSVSDFTVTFPGSTNAEIKMVFGEKVGDSSGNEWTTSTIPTFSWTSSNSSVKNLGIDSITYSTTTSTDDTITIGVSYDGDVESGDTISFTIPYGSVYDQYGNQAVSPSYSNFSSGDLTWPATGASGRSYFNRTFNIYNGDSSAAHFYIQVDSGEGEDGSEWKYIGGPAAAGTGSLVLSSIFHNDGDYGSYGSSMYVVAAASSASISGQSWSPSSEFGWGNYAQVQFDGSYGFSLEDTYRRLDITYNGGYDTSGGSFSSWSAYDASDNEIDVSIDTPTVTLANSSGTGTVTVDYGERLWTSDEYSPSSFSDLRDVALSDFSSISAYRVGESSNWDSSDLSSLTVTAFSYETSDDSGALAVYGTDNTGNYSGATGWWYPVYLDVADAGGAGSSHEHTFSEYSGVTFYMPDGTTNHGSSVKPSEYTFYEDQLQITFTYSGTPTTSDWLSLSGMSNGLFDAVLNSATFSVGDGTAATPKFSADATSTATETESIGSSGGSVTTTGGSITVPASALSSEVTIGMDVSESGSIASSDGTLAAAVGDPTAELMSPVISLTPHGQQFSEAVTVQFDLTGTSAGSCPANLQIWKRNNASSTWYQLPSNLWSCSDGTISITTTSFSEFQAIGGQGMARTTLNNAQIGKLLLANKALTNAIDITGSAAFTGNIAGTDKFMIQSSTGVASQISASVMQEFFSNVDLIDASGSTRHAIVMAVTGSQDNAKLYVDAGIEYAPDSAEFFLHGDLTIEGGKITLSNGATIDSETAGELTLSETEIKVDGMFDSSGASDIASSSGAVTIAAGGGTVAIGTSGVMTTVQGTLNVDEAVTLDTTLDVTGDTSVSSLDSSGATQLATSSGNVTIAAGGGTVEIATSGVTTTISGDIKVDEDADLDGALDVAGAVALGASGGAADTTVRGGLSVGENLTVTGNLVVSGTTVTVDAANLAIEDQQIELNRTGSSATADQGGIKLNRDDAADLKIQWSHGDSEWQLIDASSSYSDLHISALDADGAADIAGAVSLGASGGSADTTVRGDLSVAENLAVTGDFDVDGAATLDGLSVSEVASFAADITASAGLHVDGGAEINSLKVEDLTSGRIVLAGTGGEIEDSGNLTFNGSKLDVTGDADISGDFDVDGATTLDGLSVSEVASFAADITASAGLYVAQEIHVDGAADLDGALSVAGIASFAADITASAGLYVAEEIHVDGNADLDGQLDVAQAVAFASTLDVTGDTSVSTLDSTGATQLATNAGAVTIAGTGRMTTIEGTLNVDEAVTLDSSLTVDGAAQFDNASVKFTALAGVGDDAIASSAKMVFLDGDDAKSISLGELGEYLADVHNGETGIQSDADGRLSIVAHAEWFSGSGGLDAATQLTASISNEPLEDSVQVFLNGMLLTPSGSGGPAVFDYTYDYTNANQNICFVAGVVDPNDAIVIHYIQK